MGNDRSEGIFPRLMDPITRYLLLSVLIALLISVVAYWFYNRTHLFDSYTVTGSAELDDVEGTQYEFLDGKLIKYNHDGVFCVDTDNEMIWSSAFSMQTPVAFKEGRRMVIAEQQGNQVVVLGAKGVLGSFTTQLPVMKARISAGGVVALVLNDVDNVAWINLYSSQGEQIASVKATQAETGYPLDVALSPDGKQLLVSYFGNEAEELTGTLALYDFSSADSPDDSHQKGELVYEDTVFPEVFFGRSGAPCAVADDGFVVLSAGRTLKERTRVTVHDEIVSVFHDSSNIGFVFRSIRTDSKFRMQIYSLNGKQTMDTEFNFSYSDSRMENGEILVYDASSLHIYRTSGKEKLNVSYNKEVRYFAPLGKTRRYLIITDNSADRIRIS